MIKKRILVTGANGFLASSIQQYHENQFEYIPLYRKDLDLSNIEMIAEVLGEYDVDIILHTAAMTQTKDCEENPELSHKINVEAVQEIVRYCNVKNIRLIAFSSEQVFSGKQNAPFSEEDEMSSLTRYGQDKIEADRIIMSQANDYVLLRLSWMFGLSYPGVKAGPNILGQVHSAILKNRPQEFTVNEKRGLTYMGALAKQFSKLAHLPKGIYQFTSTNTLSTYDSAVYIAKQLGASNNVIKELILANHDKYSETPRDLRMNNQKIKEFGIELSLFEENVFECMVDFDLKKGISS